MFVELTSPSGDCASIILLNVHSIRLPYKCVSSTHRAGQASDLIRLFSSCNDSGKQRGLQLFEPLECSFTVGTTVIYHVPMAQGHLKREEDSKSQGLRKSTAKCCLLNILEPLACCTRPRQPIFLHGVERDSWTPLLTEALRTAGGLWRKEKLPFIRDVDPGKFTTLQYMALYTRIYGQCKLESMCY